MFTKFIREATMKVVAVSLAVLLLSVPAFAADDPLAPLTNDGLELAPLAPLTPKNVKPKKHVPATKPAAVPEKKPEAATATPTPTAETPQAKEADKKVEPKAPEAKVEPAKPAENQAKKEGPVQTPPEKEAPKTDPPKVQATQAKPAETQPMGPPKAEPKPTKKSAKKKVAVLDVKSVGTFDPKTVQGLTTYIASEVEKSGYRVVTGAEIIAIIGFDRQRQLLGCTDSSCLAEIGGSLGVDYLLDTEVSEVGGTWLLTSTLISASKSQAIKRVTRRIPKITVLIDTAQKTTQEALSFLPPVPKETTGDQPSRWMAWTGTALGIAGALTAGAGGAFGVMAKSDYDKAKTANGVNKADFDTYKQGAASKSKNADICYAIGGAVAAVGITLIIIDVASNSEPTKSVTVLATGNGIGVAGTW
jgi:hypothetical protein